MTRDGEPATFDTSVAHVARVYNYWLGGKDNFAADRAAGEQAIKAFPNIVLSARANRAFLARAVRSWPEKWVSASSWISGPAFPRRTIPMRSPSRWRRIPGPLRG